MNKRARQIFSFVFTTLVFIPALIPLSYNFIISFKNYSPVSGMRNSPFVGFSNYMKLIETGFFIKLFSNTLFQGILFAIFLFIMASAAGIIIYYIKNSFLLALFSTLCIIPLFIPDVVYVSWFMQIPYKENPLTVRDQAMWFLPFLKAIKYSGVPILATVALFELRNSKSLYVVFQSAACFSLFSLMFITNNDATITNLVHNPLIYDVTNTFSNYIYRTGLLENNFSYAAAIHLVGRFLSLLAALVFFIPFKKIVSNLFGADNREGEVKTKGEGPLAPLLSVAVSFVIFLIPFFFRGLGPSNLDFSSIPGSLHLLTRSLPAYFSMALAVAAINVFISYWVSCSLICGGKIMQRITIAMVIFLAVYTGDPVDMGKYLLFRQLGIFNTYFAVIFGHITSISCIWAFVTVAKAKGVPKRAEYFHAVKSILIPLILIQFVMIFNNYYPSLIFTSSREMLSPMVLYRELMLGIDIEKSTPLIILLGTVLSVVPLSILVYLKTRLKKSDLLSLLSFANRK